MPVSWTPITQAWVAENGYQVVPLSSEEQMESMGRSLHNGLIDPVPRGKWADLCVQGRRQVVLVVDPTGIVVANSFLRANPSADGSPARFESLFTRGRETTVFAEGDPAFDAVASYVQGVNDGTIELDAEMDANGVVQDVPALEEAVPSGPDLASMTALERATLRAEELGISPFDALLAGHGELPSAPVAGPVAVTQAVEPQSWTPLSEPFTAANGWRIEPVSDAAGMQRLGEELDNMLFLDRMRDAENAKCAAGVARFVAIKDPEGVIRGFAEFGCTPLQPVLTTARGYCDGRLPAAPAPALLAGPGNAFNPDSYYAGLASGAIPMLVTPGPHGFTDTGAGIDLLDALGSGHGASVPRGLMQIAGPLGIVTGGGAIGYDGGDDADAIGYDGDDGDEGYDEDPDGTGGVSDVLDGDGYQGHVPGTSGDRPPYRDNYAGESVAPSVPATSWPVLVGDWTEQGIGLRVSLAADVATLARMGQDFGNALNGAGYRAGIAAQCARGESQVFQVFRDYPDGSTMVANGLVHVRDGEVRIAPSPMGGEGGFFFGPGSTVSEAQIPASSALRTLVSNWLQKVNSGELALQGEITDTGFRFTPAPGQAPGLN